MGIHSYHHNGYPLISDKDPKIELEIKKAIKHVEDFKSFTPKHGMPLPVLPWQTKLLSICTEETQTNMPNVHVVIDGGGTTRTDFMLDVHQGVFKIEDSSFVHPRTIHGCLIPPICKDDRDAVFNYIIAGPEDPGFYLFSHSGRLEMHTPMYAMIAEVASRIIYVNTPPFQLKILRGPSIIVLTDSVDDHIPESWCVWKVWKVVDGKLVSYQKWKDEDDKMQENRKRGRKSARGS